MVGVADRAIADFALVRETNFAKDVLTGVYYHHLDRDAVAEPAVKVLLEHALDPAYFWYEFRSPTLQARQQFGAPIDRIEVVCTVQPSDFTL